MAKEFGIKLHLDIKKKDGRSISSIEHKIEIPNLGINKFKQIVRPRTDGSDEADLELVDTGVQDYLSSTSGKENIYVAKESKHIFEPKEGDLINYKSRSGKNEITATYLETFLDDDNIQKWRLQSQGMNSPKIYKIDSRKFSIIMRENKQFFMPEGGE